MSDKPQLALMHNMARTGGTLVARCLGCMDNVALLSEIHPRGMDLIHPFYQAHEWHHLFTPEMVTELSGRPVEFLEAITIIYQCCEERGLSLLIRDWAHLDYIALPFLEAPVYTMSIVDALASEFTLRRVANVRHPIAQWQSMSKLKIYEGDIEKFVPLETYLKAYRKFAEDCQEIEVIRYEDFTAAPETTIQQISNELGLPYDNQFMTKWPAYTHYTGDQSFKKDPGKTAEILPARLPEVAADLLARFEQHDDYHQSLQLLGYR